MWQSARPDIEVGGVDVLVRGATHIPVRPFDGYTLPYDDNSMDVVTFVDVLHHADDAQTLLREAARVARQKIVIKDHLAENAFDHATLRLMDWVGNAPHGVVLPYNYFSWETWQQHFCRAGLQLLQVKTDVPLYAPPLTFVFGRHLHFVAQLRPVQLG
jgi:SAM-dependent methyltransferase